MKDIFLKLMFHILKIYTTFTMVYPFLLKKMKTEKIEKLVENFHDKEEHVTDVRNLKEALNQELMLNTIQPLNVIKNLS